MSKIYQISGCQNASRKADVLFLHGLGGDAFGTWRNGKDGSISWPQWLGEEFSDVGVWSLGYSASPTKWMLPVGWLLSKFFPSWRDAGHTMSLPDRAGQVLDLMVQHGFGDRPILFICHSLGGLLGKQILRKASDATDIRKRAVWENTRGVLFLATPHSGAILASLLNSFRIVFGATVSIEDLRVHDAHLRDLYDWYRNHATLLNVQTVTYYEMRSAKNVMPIVNPTSSHPGVGADPVALDEDHLSIAKPRDREAQVCGAARDLLKNYVLIMRKKCHVESMSPTPAEQVVPSIEKRVIRELPPAAPTKFFGRKTELQQLTARLKDGKNSAIIGPAGMGKTALAAAAMETVIGRTAESLANSPFPDGVVFLDLYTLRGQAEPAWHTLANKLAGAEFRETTSARERAIEVCRGLNILVIIEGGEEANGREGRARIDELLGVLSPNNRWLLLTRDSTQAAHSETVKLHAVLSPDEAGELFDCLTEGQITGTVRDRVLRLLEGHPLALTWASNLLARGDDDPARLADEWEAQELPALTDPVRAEHTLEWLFNRSIRGLDGMSRQALAAAGLLARAPFPASAIEVAIGSSTRDALRQLVQRGLIRLAAEENYREFTHVLAYRFARQEMGANADLRRSLGNWMHHNLTAVLANPQDVDGVIFLSRLLQHAAAILQTDHDQQLWKPLVYFLLYEGKDRFGNIGRLELSNAALGAVSDWFACFPPQKILEPVWEREHLVCINFQGNLARAQGKLSESARFYGKGLQLTRRLSQSDPVNTQWQRDLLVSFIKLGDIFRAQGKLSRTDRLYREALKIAKHLVQADPTNSEWQRDLSVTFIKLGEVAQTQGKLSEANLFYGETLQLTNRLAQADPNNTQLQRDLSVLFLKLGNIAKVQGNLDEAGRYYSEALCIRQKLVEADHYNTQWQSDLSVLFVRLGEVAQLQGKLPEAVRNYNEVLRVRQCLAQIDPINSQWQNDLAGAFIMLGEVVKLEGKLSEADCHYSEALRIRRELAQADPTNSEWKRDLSVVFIKLGEVAQSLGKLSEADCHYSETLRIRRELAQADPTNSKWQRDLWVTFIKLGEVAQVQGKFIEADGHYTAALPIAQRLAQADPTNTHWQRDLSVWFFKLGEVALIQGNLTKAHQHYTDGLIIIQRLAEADLTNTQWQRDLSFAYTALGQLFMKEQRWSEALAVLKESLVINEQLLSRDSTNVVLQKDASVSHRLITEVRTKLN